MWRSTVTPVARRDDTTLAAPSAPESERGELAVVIWRGASPRVERLPHGRAVIVGRSAPADLVVDDPTLSRSHVRLTALGEYVRVEDLDSKNGIAVDGSRTDRSDVLPGGQVVAGVVRLVITTVGGPEVRVERLATFDQLRERADAEVARARMYGRPLTLALVSGEADDSAVDLALRLRAHLRPFDTVAIYDPSRVCALLPELDANDAGRLIGRRDATIASWPDSGANADSLIRCLLDGSGPGREPDEAADTSAIIGAGLEPALELARRFATSALPVSILGETGTGKEMLARQIHAWSPRRDHRIKVVNCAALPATLLESTLFGHERGAFTGAEREKPGLFEQADGGTLFLDEIGELSVAGQAALLRVLEEGSVTRVGGTDSRSIDVRIVAATNRNLPAEVERGAFRLDLWHRLNALIVELPPLRDRPGDLLELAARFLTRAQSRTGATWSLSGEAVQLMLDYGWPGNVRELENVIERAALLADSPEIDVAALPERISRSARTDVDLTKPSAPLRDMMTRYEERLIINALDRCRGNQAAAARELGVPRRTLVRKIAQFGLRHRDRWSDDDDG